MTTTWIQKALPGKNSPSLYCQRFVGTTTPIRNTRSTSPTCRLSTYRPTRQTRRRPTGWRTAREARARVADFERIHCSPANSLARRKDRDEYEAQDAREDRENCNTEWAPLFGSSSNSVSEY